MPCIDLACRIIDGSVYRVVDDQVQRIHLCTTVGIRVAVGVITTFDISGTVPSKALAFSFGNCGMRGIEDGQVQRINTRTTITIRVGIRINIRGGICSTMPHITLAGIRDSKRIMRAILHRQIQRHHTVAARCIAAHEGVLCRGIVPRVEIVVDPSETVAHRPGVRSRSRLFHADSNSCGSFTTREKFFHRDFISSVVIGSMSIINNRVLLIGSIRSMFETFPFKTYFFKRTIISMQINISSFARDFGPSIYVKSKSGADFGWDIIYAAVLIFHIDVVPLCCKSCELWRCLECFSIKRITIS